MIEFRETQKFKQVWIWITLIITGLIVFGTFGTGFYKQIIQGQKFGANPMSNTGITVGSILALIVFILMFLLFGFAKLTTVVNSKGITYRFFPFHIKYRTLLWDNITKYEVITYDPLLDYGGWGVRSGRKGKAYNVEGNRGLQLYFKSGRPLLIGTQKGEELSIFLSKIK
jgi:hypothetical protein